MNKFWGRHPSIIKNISFNPSGLTIIFDSNFFLVFKYLPGVLFRFPSGFCLHSPSASMEQKSAETNKVVALYPGWLRLD
jgi:hypothetical protein